MRRLIFVILILAVVIGLYGIYLFNKKPVDTRDEKADYQISAVDLVKEFSMDEEKATKKYSNKILLVAGTVSEVNLTSATVFVDAGDPIASVTCSFYADEQPHILRLKNGDAVQIKGKCTGKLTDVVLNNCSLNLLNQ